MNHAAHAEGEVAVAHGGGATASSKYLLCHAPLVYSLQIEVIRFQLPSGLEATAAVTPAVSEQTSRPHAEGAHIDATQTLTEEGGGSH
jgi:predicted alpha/beta-hydrolase family hydrolase